MNINQVTNLNNSLQNKAKNQAQSQNDFNENLNQALSQILSNQSLSYIIGANTEEFKKSINNIFNKIDEVIAPVKKEKNNEFIIQLEQLKHTFDAQVTIHNDTLVFAKKISKTDTEKLAKNSFKEELSYNISIQNSYSLTIEHRIIIASTNIYGILEAWDKNIQEAKNLQIDIAKIIRYFEDTYNSRVARTKDFITTDINLKYVSHKEIQTQNKLLESLLKISNETT